MSRNDILIERVASILNQWLNEQKETPTAEAIEKFLKINLPKNGVEIAEDASVTEDTRHIPALLRPSESVNKRMRELAGIPHKGNFT